jgi:aminoglycoside phosphotransferase (APT) family kinase protein
VTTTSAYPQKYVKPLRTEPVRRTITYSVPPAPSEAQAADDLAWFMTNARPVLLALHRLSAADLQLLAERRRWFERRIKSWDSEPDEVDLKTPGVSDEQDERNSRPEPY